MLCSKCFKYHKGLCTIIIIRCTSCGHRQKTRNNDIGWIKCSVCNRNRMEMIKNG